VPVDCGKKNIYIVLSCLHDSCDTISYFENLKLNIEFSEFPYTIAIDHTQQIIMKSMFKILLIAVNNDNYYYYSRLFSFKPQYLI